MERLSYEEKLAITAASRAIITGKKRSHEDLCKRAIGKQRNAKPSKYEAALLAALRERGISPVLHFAFDKFNIDLALPSDRLAIEVDGGNWHRTQRRKMEADQRKQSLLEQEGWAIVRCNTRRQNWVAESIDRVMSLLPVPELH